MYVPPCQKHTGATWTTAHESESEPSVDPTVWTSCARGTVLRATYLLAVKLHGL